MIFTNVPNCGCLLVITLGILWIPLLWAFSTMSAHTQVHTFKSGRLFGLELPGDGLCSFNLTGWCQSDSVNLCSHQLCVRGLGGEGGCGGAHIQPLGMQVFDSLASLLVCMEIHSCESVF